MTWVDAGCCGMERAVEFGIGRRFVPGCAVFCQTGNPDGRFPPVPFLQLKITARIAILAILYALIWFLAPPAITLIVNTCIDNVDVVRYTSLDPKFVGTKVCPRRANDVYNLKI